jgi:hypothetical protein
LTSAAVSFETGAFLDVAQDDFKDGPENKFMRTFSNEACGKKLGHGFALDLVI